MSAALVPEIVETDETSLEFRSYSELVSRKTNAEVRRQRASRRLGRVNGLSIYDVYELIQEGKEPDLDEATIAEFLEAYALTGQVPKAAAVVGVWPPSIYLLARRNEEFRRAMQAARQIALNLAEDELFRRGFEGVEEPIYYQGEEVGTKRVYSDSALLRVLEAERPDKWKKRIANEHTGENGAPIAIDDARSSIASKVEAAFAATASRDHSEPEAE